MKSRLFSMLATISWLLAVGLTQAQVPRTINYQGYLTTPSGAPVNNPALQMVFNLYNVAASGSALHTETQTVVVTNGVFNVLLGSVATLTLPFDVPYYLGVTPGADAEMTPRQALAASPYAIRAASADALSPGATVPGSQIGNASITASKLASSGCTGNQVLQYNGSAWVCATLPATSAGTVTSIATGTGLQGGPITSAGTIAVDFTVVQPRLSASCPPGASIREISNGAIVVCESLLSAGTSPPQGTATPTLDSGADVGRNTSIVIGVDGLPLILYYDSTNAQSKLLRCGKPDCSATISVATFPGMGPHNAITIGDTGMPVVAFATAAGLRMYRCVDAGCTTTPTLRGIDNSTSISNLTAAISSDGRPIFTYQRNQSVRVALCGNTSCSGVPSIHDVRVGLTAPYPSMVIAPDGRPVIAIYDETFDRMVVVKCGNLACDSGNTENPILDLTSAANGLGQFTSLAIGADGLPVVAYHKATASLLDLMVFKCSDPVCSVGSSSTVTVDSAGDVGKYASLTIGQDGLPAIAYFDATNADIRYVKCSTAACTAYNHKQTIASNGDLGRFASIATRDDGLPIIAYYDATNAVLKVAACSNTFCTPYLRRR